MISLDQFDVPARAVLVHGRRHALHRRRRTMGSADIMAGLIDRDEIAGLLSGAGFSLPALAAPLGDGPPPADALLGGLGIDAAAVRAALGATTAEGAPWRLRRWRARPLRITLEGPSSAVAFDRSGRKVLEVAVWASARGGRIAGPVDLLRGVLADGRDPIVATLCAAGPGPIRRLWEELARQDAPPA